MDRSERGVQVQREGMFGADSDARLVDILRFALLFFSWGANFVLGEQIRNSYDPKKRSLSFVPIVKLPERST